MYAETLKALKKESDFIHEKIVIEDDAIKSGYEI
jgi:hypothetical protein